MAVTLVTRFQDGESDTNFDAVPLHFPATPTLATLQAYFDGLAPLFDAVTGAKIVGADALYSLTLPAGLKASPVATALNERGGLMGFSMSIPNTNDSVRIPAILPAIMSGDEFSITDTDIAALANYIIGTQSGIEAVNRWVASYEAITYGRKSFRRK